MIRKAILLALGIAPMLAPFAGCGDGESGQAGAVDAGDSADARVDGPRVDSAPPSDAAADREPAYNTDGWIEIPFDPDFDCKLYAAPSPEKMPHAIQWESCDPAMTAGGWSCRKMVTNWAPPAASGDTKVIGLAGRVDANARTWIALRRFSGSSIFQLVAEADGPVHQAIVSPRRNCYLNDASLAEGKVVFSTSRQSETQVYRWGAIGGDIDKFPMVLESWATSAGRGYAAGPNAYLTFPAYALRSWSSPSAEIAPIPTPSPGGAVYFSFVGDSVFFPFGTLDYHRISVFSPGIGTKDLVSYGNDVSKAASDFGTDGTDMVWVEAFGRGSVAEPWTTMNIMAAPFTADPALLQKRRLRSESGNVGTSPFVVGCGYAAHHYSSSTEGTGARLVRLSDGRSWRFKTINGGSGTNYYFHDPLALTCDELFLSFHSDNGNVQFNVARIRLDSLGPGDAAD